MASTDVYRIMVEDATIDMWKKEVKKVGARKFKSNMGDKLGVKTTVKFDKKKDRFYEVESKREIWGTSEIFGHGEDEEMVEHSKLAQFQKRIHNTPDLTSKEKAQITDGYLQFSQEVTRSIMRAKNKDDTKEFRVKATEETKAFLRFCEKNDIPTETFTDWIIDDLVQTMKADMKM